METPRKDDFDRQIDELFAAHPVVVPSTPRRAISSTPRTPPSITGARPPKFAKPNKPFAAYPIALPTTPRRAISSAPCSSPSFSGARSPKFARAKAKQEKLVAARRNARPKGKDRIAFAFAIDGVLLRDGKLLSGAEHSIRFLIQRQIPFVVFANAKLCDYDQRRWLLQELRKVSINLPPHQIIGHDGPFALIALQYDLWDRHVLIIGGDGERNVRRLAFSSGFEKIWTPASLGPRDDVPITVIMIWSDSNNWDRDLGIICRLMLKHWRDINIFICTDDFNRVTDNKYRTIDYWAFYHMLMGRPELEDDTEWVDQILREPWVNNGGKDIFATMERDLEQYNQYGPSGPSHALGLPAGNDVIKKAYLVTEDARRDMRRLERHVATAGPQWTTLLISEALRREPSADWGSMVKYAADKEFTDVWEAVSYSLAHNHLATR